MTRRALTALALALVLVFALRPHVALSKNIPGDMGLVVTDMSPDALRAAGVPNGLLVIGVVPDGPADRKGIIEGDIILEYENEPVRSAAIFYGRVRRDGAGFLAGLRVRHDGVDRWIGFVPLEAAPAPPPTATEIDDKFRQLEDEIDGLTARIEKLEKARTIPRRQVLPKADEETPKPETTDK